jgi:transcriptional regulator with XRE-family HTH domain
MPDLPTLRAKIAALKYNEPVEDGIDAARQSGWHKHRREVLALIDRMIAEEQAKPLDLRQARLARGYGLRQFAEHIGMQPSDYSNIEHGRITANTYQRDVLCDALGLDELPPIPPPRDNGPIVPVFVKAVDGQPLSDEAARRLYDTLNRPRTIAATVTASVTESMPAKGEVPAQ